MSRGGKIAIKLLVALVVMGGVAAVADRVALNLATARIGQEVSSALEARGTTATGTTAAVAGFPFLTQVLAGEYQKITIDIEQPKIATVQLVNLNLVASDVAADTRALLSGSGTVRAREVVGNADLSWNTVREILEVGGVPGLDLADVQLTAENDQLRLRMPVPSFGHGVVLLGTGKFEIEQGTVRLRVSDLRAEGGPLPTVVQRQIDQLRLTATLKLPQLPYNLAVNEIKASSTGIRVKATARDVTLAG